MPEATRVVSALPVGTAVFRFIIMKALGRGDHADEQRDVYAAWRASTLAQIRQWLQAEITTW